MIFRKFRSKKCEKNFVIRMLEYGEEKKDSGVSLSEMKAFIESKLVVKESIFIEFFFTLFAPCTGTIDKETRFFIKPDAYTKLLDFKMFRHAIIALVVSIILLVVSICFSIIQIFAPVSIKQKDIQSLMRFIDDQKGLPEFTIDFYK